MVYKEDYEFKIGKGIKLMSGKDISIFCTGRMVHNSLEAAKLLKEQNIVHQLSIFIRLNRLIKNY